MITDYKDYIQAIKEGLIVSHDSKKAADLISWNLSKYNIQNKVIARGKFEILISILNNNLDIDLLNALIINYSNLYGYYLSNFKLKFNDNSEKNYKWNQFNIEIHKQINNVKTIYIKFESKYEDGLYTNDIICPDTLYHLTKTDYIKNIQKKGLYPKSKNKKSDHPERIYLFSNLNSYPILLKLLKNEEPVLYILLEIDCRKDKLMLHTDPNFYTGLFTYDNIHPSNIKIIKNNL